MDQGFHDRQRALYGIKHHSCLKPWLTNSLRFLKCVKCILLIKTKVWAIEFQMKQIQTDAAGMRQVDTPSCLIPITIYQPTVEIFRVLVFFLTTFMAIAYFDNPACLSQILTERLSGRRVIVWHLAFRIPRFDMSLSLFYHSPCIRRE